MTLPPARRRLFTAVAACTLISVASLLPVAQAAETQVRVDSISLDSRLQLGGQTLRLNGAGTFAPLKAFAWVKGYVAALYLVDRAGSHEQVLATNGAKRLQMRMLLDVPVAEFVKAFHKGVGRNTPQDQQPGLVERMERFDQMIRPLGKVLKGDAINIDYLPGRGMLLSHNGRELGAAIPGDDFYDALLGVFVGPKPVDDALKAALLGSKT